MKLWSIILLTFRESLAKKTFMAFLGISTFICLLLIFALNLDIVNGMQSSVSLFGQDIESAAEITKILFGIESGIAILLFSGGIFMSLFATSSLVPSLLQEGYIDIFISKPVSRLDILLGRYLGAIVIVALNIFYLVIFFGRHSFHQNGYLELGIFMGRRYHRTHFWGPVCPDDLPECTQPQRPSVADDYLSGIILQPYAAGQG